jgi:hypothetical protein
LKGLILIIKTGGGMLAGFLLKLIFDSEDGGDMFLRNAG